METGDGFNHDIDRIAAIADPVARARAAGEQQAQHQSAVNRLAKIRRTAIAELRAQGLSYAQVGDSLGVTRGRIAQLRGPDASTEAAFFGGRTISIATPLRAQPGGRLMVAQEDVDTATVLAEYLARLDLDTSMQRIPPEGAPDFEPDALVVICGPGTSPTIGELLRSDPTLDYSQRADGTWTIVDRESSREFRSPIDDGSTDRDIAYLGRLHRPDGRPFILIAGIHATGSLGVAHYLVTAPHLRELQETTPGPARFSMVIACQFDPDTLSIRGTEAASPPRAHAES